MTKREREITDLGQIEAIIAKCKVLHLGLVDNGLPYIVPMNYGYTMTDGRLKLYLHSGLKGYKLDVIRQNPNCCFEMECDVEPFEGRVACQYGMAYSSVIGRGVIRFVEDVTEKEKAMSILMKTQTGKDFEFNEKLVSILHVLEIDVTEFTAKHRPVPPNPTVK